MHYSGTVKTLLRRNILIKSSTCGFSMNVKTLRHKPNHVNTLFQSQSVKASLNYCNNCSTANSPKTQYSKSQRFMLNFVNFDVILTIAFFCFLYKDYKKYKEQGEGLIIK